MRIKSVSLLYPLVAAYLIMVVIFFGVRNNVKAETGKTVFTESRWLGNEIGNRSVVYTRLDKR